MLRARPAKAQMRTPLQATPAYAHASQWLAFDETKHPLLPLLVAAFIPLLLLAGVIAYSAAERQRAAALQAANTTIDRVVEQIAAKVNVEVQVAQGLALSEALDRPALEAFRREAERLKAARPLWRTVELDDLDGTQVMNLLMPAGAWLGQTADRRSFEEVLRERRPVVGGVGPAGPISERQLVALRVPVMRDDKLRWVLTVQFATKSIDAILRRSSIPPGWAGAVVDGRGDLIARSDASEEKAVGKSAYRTVQEAIHRSIGGYYEGRTAGGVDVETLFKTMPDVGGWSVHLAIPRAILERPVHEALVAVVVAVALSLGLAAALAAAVAGRFSRARRAEGLRAAALLEASEDRGRLAVEAGGLGMWRWDTDRDVISGSERFAELMVLPRSGEWSSAHFTARVHGGERDTVLKAAQQCLDGARDFQVEFRVLDSFGSVRWLRALGHTLGSGDVSAIVGVLADVTAQKRAETERVDLLRRLSKAQEDVQGRIARELHDQVGQTVTGLALGLKGLENVLDGEGPVCVQARRTLLTSLKTLAGEIGRDLHRVAADLRPTALDDLGLGRALAAYAAEWGERYGIAVDVDSLGAPGRRLPSEAETAVYRAVQEALTNVVKHAEARHVSVVIEQRVTEVRVVVEDDGVGFDPVAVQRREAARTPSRRRLGLSGMFERLTLNGGTLQVESSPGSGTTLFLRVPFPLSAEAVPT